MPRDSQVYCSLDLHEAIELAQRALEERNNVVIEHDSVHENLHTFTVIVREQRDAETH